MASHTVCCGVGFWVYILIIVGLVLFAGMMSGLTLGLMSLGLVDLEVLMKSGTPADRKHAGMSLSSTFILHISSLSELLQGHISILALGSSIGDDIASTHLLRCSLAIFSLSVARFLEFT